MHLVIIGNGIAGVSAARRLRQQDPDCRITMISGESRFHYSRPALMYIFMGHVRYQDTKPYEDDTWAKERIDLLRGWVTKIDTAARRIELHQGKSLSYDKLLIATGSRPNRFGWPGQDLDGVQGLWGLYDLKTLHTTCERTRHAAIVGGGLIGIEMAEMLRSRGIGVSMLVRESSYWNNVLNAEESELVNQEIRRHGVDLQLNTELEAIEGDAEGRVRAIRPKPGKELPCQLVGLTAGVSPNIALAKEAGLDTQRGVLVNARFETSTPHVFAAGDCAEIQTQESERNLIQQVWYTGKMQGEVVGDVLAGKDRSYEEVTWYNSAKFFDLEYQTYGRVNRKVDGEQNLYWQHPTEARSMRIVHRAGEGVIGVQSMGIRTCHRVCQRWIENHTPVEQALGELEEANFDPEFYKRHEASFRAAFAKELVR